ncbi:transposase [Diaminobutyricibacter tongyongensis]|uniref:Transposase n=1 Tax=Leifsonia tongyongensis TaxID=1268043 RepID=A0A6L9Y2G2_9MICO|nr:Mu transposase C-terminal domain-containing protein [Diaminobutyricibacter tongyongensis]NEN07756.1 transposase [Diaminobutyricibacter tongyongensis]
MFDIDSELKLIDGKYFVVEIQGNFYRMRNSATGAYTVLTSHELPARLAEPPTRLVANPRQLETVSTAERDDLNFWVDHLRELDTGRKSPTSPFNPAYDPDTVGVNQRVEAKVKELTFLGHPTSRSTLMRKRKKFKEGGITALIDGREVRTETPVDNADSRIIEAFRETINGAIKKSTKTKLGHIAEAVKLVKDRHPGIEIPSQATLYRWYNYLASGKRLSDTFANRSSLNSVPKRSFGDTRKYFPGQYVEIDSTPLDAFVYDEDGNVGRPILTIMVDVCTRTIVAHSFRIVAAKAVDHAFLLAQALTPRRLRPNSDQQWRAVLQRFPWVELVSEEERDSLDNTRPFIAPDSITVDHGTDYTGTTFEAACDLYEVSLLYAAPGTPTDKNHVERTFDTIKRGFVEHLATFTGGSPGHRGSIEDEPLLDLVTLDQLFDEWVTRVYQNSPHDGLFDPFRPSVTLTPNEMYAATWDLSPSQPVPMDTIDYIALLPASRRQIQAQGIQFENRFYDSLALQALRNHAPRMDSTGNPINSWELRANPYDPRAIWVLTPENDWLEVPWRHRAAIDQPHQTRLWNEANRIVAANPNRFSPLEKRLMTLDIIESAGISTVTISKIRAQQKAAQKMAAIGGTPIPTAELTTLETSFPTQPNGNAVLDEIDDELRPYKGEEI